MLNEILIPIPKLSEAEVQRIAKVQTAPYSLEDVEDCYFVGDEDKTHYLTCFAGLDLLIGETSKETYLNVQLFIYSKCKQ